MGRKKQKEKITILISDDDEDTGESFKYIFEKTQSDKYAIIHFAEVEDCFDFLEKQIPDVIISDIMKPGMSGWQFFDKIKDNPKWRDIPFIFVTAHTDRVTENAASYLADDYIQKPVDPEDLMKRIDKAVQKFEKRKLIFKKKINHYVEQDKNLFVTDILSLIDQNQLSEAEKKLMQRNQHYDEYQKILNERDDVEKRIKKLSMKLTDDEISSKTFEVSHTDLEKERKELEEKLWELRNKVFKEEYEKPF